MSIIDFHPHDFTNAVTVCFAPGVASKQIVIPGRLRDSHHLTVTGIQRLHNLAPESRAEEPRQRVGIADVKVRACHAKNPRVGNID